MSQSGPARARRFAGRVRRGVTRRAKAAVKRIPRRPVPAGRTEGIDNRLLAAKRVELAGKRTFGRHDFDRLARLLDRADAVVPVREAYARRDDWPERFATMRHDMDHDLANSVRFAEWEAEHGIRSTYFVLHGDWYWGGPGATEPSPMVLRGLDRIASLGHEVGLHNNAISLALQTGLDPFAILERDLTALRRHGFEITGSVAHGDPMCHAAGYVNNELFSDCQSWTGREAGRTIVHRDEAGTEHSLQLSQRPMADFGLGYEANAIGHTRYLSDTGGRWNQPFSGMDDLFEREGGFLQLLVHPVWWALSGETVKPRPTVEPARDVAAAVTGDPSAPPFEIVVRGDCCSRRAIDMNRDLFGGNPVMVRDEKARTDFFLDHLRVGSPTHEDVTRLMDVEAMSPSLRHYALGQVERTTLETDKARLLVLDDYSDMNFGAWQHREAGWKLWVNRKFIRDQAAFEREFRDVGQLTFEQSLADQVALIEAYRRRYGDVPVLYLHQPIAYYRKLESRDAFRRMGPELELAVPNLYAGDLHDADLEPDDMGSCGPGQTLHFTGPTYRAMINVALEKGLGDWLSHATHPTPV